MVWKNGFFWKSVILEVKNSDFLGFSCWDFKAIRGKTQICKNWYFFVKFTFENYVILLFFSYFGFFRKNGLKLT